MGQNGLQPVVGAPVIYSALQRFLQSNLEHLSTNKGQPMSLTHGSSCTKKTQHSTTLAASTCCRTALTSLVPLQQSSTPQCGQQMPNIQVLHVNTSRS